MNLLHNAIKFTPEGGTVSLAIGEDSQWAIVSVIDTGAGIAEDEIPLVFERFYRVDKARTRHEEGSGLGLPTAKRIVEEHGGKIETHSEEGRGSSFSVILPVAAQGK